MAGPRAAWLGRCGALLASLSIRARLILLVMVLVLPACGTLCWFLVSSLEHLRAVAYARVQVMAEVAAADIRHKLGAIESDLADTARTLESSGPLQHACDAGQSNATRHFMPLALLVTDRQGRLLCRRLLQSGPEALQAAEEAQALLGAGSGADDLIVHTTRGGTSFVMLRQSIFDADASMSQTVWAAIDLRLLNGEMFRSIPRDVVVAVVDGESRIALRSANAATYIGTALPANALLRTAVADGHGSAPGLDGVVRLFAHVRIPELGWRVAAGVPRATVMAEYDRIFNSAVLLAVLLSAMALAAAHQLGVAIVRPIRRLQSAVARVASGDDQERAETTGPPEVRALAEQFNHMVDVRSVAQARLQGVLDSAVDAIVSADESQNIVQANPAASAMFGHPIETLIGMPLERLMPLRHQALHRCEVAAFGKNRPLQRHMGRQREVSAMRADGSEFPVEATISHLRVDGRVMYTAILRDVSERVKAAQALRASERMLRRLLQELPEAVFVNTDMRVTFVNSAAQELFGGPEDALLGRSPLELIHPDFHALAIQRITALHEGASSAPMTDIRILRLDGTTREAETLGTLIEHEGQTSILVLLRDVTDLRMAQRELEKSRSDLRLLVAAMEDIQEQERLRISRDLHDDLQQTLAAIRMDADMLAQRASADGEIAADAARIDSLAASAIASIRRLISGLRPQSLEELGLTEALRSLAREFSRRNGVLCECRIAREMESTELDSRKSTCLYRVLQESLNNVLKHAAARHVEIRFELDGDSTHCRLSIRDDGRGMRPGDCDKSDSFGLIGMRERVRAVGGRLRIESRPGGGTLIEAIIPIS